MGWVANTMPRHVLTLKKKPSTHCTGCWVDARVSLDGCRKSRPTRIQFPDIRARSKSLYRLCNSGHSLIRQKLLVKRTVDFHWMR